MTYALTTQAPYGCAQVYTPVSNPGASPWCHFPETKPVERATIIYAHPDDETIFTAGLMLAYPEWEWTLIRFVGDADPANARETDHARAIELFRDAGVNIVTAVCVGAPDKDLDWTERTEWAASLARIHGRPDVVFTHGYRGEYGHPHHTAIHAIVHTLYDNVWDIFHPSDLPEEPQLVRGRVHVVPTDERKRAIMEQAYPDMLNALTNAAPELVRGQFSGTPEFYTR